VFNYTAEQLKKKGAPIDWFGIPPIVSMPNSVAVAANAPHPYAATLFFDFVLADAQKIFADRDYVATNLKVPSPLDRDKVMVMDSAKMLKDSERWQRLYSEVVSHH
jgi:iron(III) transport system substrate-binding protein